MNHTLKTIAVVLSLGASSLAQEELAIRSKGNHKLPPDAEKIYVTSCAAVEREFRTGRTLRPPVTLVLGTRDNGADLGKKEIRLSEWNPYLFAQGVVAIAFDELLPASERMAVARRAVIWADSTVEAKSLAK